MAMRFKKGQFGANKLAACLIALAITAGCASTTVSNRQQVATGYLPRPNQVWVYDFAATPADVPPESSLAGQTSADTAPQTADQIAEGRKLAAQITANLIQQIGAMGLSAATFQMTPTGLRKLGSGDVGATGNKTPGSAVGLAVLIASHNPAGLIVSTGMKVYGEKSGSSTVEGRAKQISQEIADALKKRFQEQGWISAS